MRATTQLVRAFGDASCHTPMTRAGLPTYCCYSNYWSSDHVLMTDENEATLRALFSTVILKLLVHSSLVTESV
jgi:hypothetical protein